MRNTPGQLIPVKPQGTTSALRVVAYYRMSTDDQKTSIAQQQADVRAACKRNGWEMIREYDDPGKSGLLPWSKRAGFVSMLNECRKLKDVNAVVVWHSSRFGRADALDAAEPKRILRDAGMWLESLAEGRIDWNTSMGRMMDAMLAEQNNGYSQTLSKNVVRGQADRVRKGWRAVGAAPYGYDRQYIDPEGKRDLFIRRTEHFQAPPRWGLRLVINEEEAAIVREIFQRYTAGQSITSIARELNRRQVDVPYKHRPTKLFKRKSWGLSTIRVLLGNRAYIGTSIIGATPGRKSMNKVEYHERPDTFPPIIAAKQFEEAQRLSAIMCERKVKPRTSSGGPLNGVLICGCCGLPLYRKPEMSGTVNRRQIVYYTCKNGIENPALTCKTWRVREDQILPVVLAQVVNAIDFEALKRLEAKPPTATDKAEFQRLLKRRDDLRADIETGTANLMRANAKTFPLIQEAVNRLQEEMDKLTNALKLATADQSDTERKARLAWLRDVKGKLVTVAEAEGMANATPHPFTPNSRQLDSIHELLGKGQSGTVYVDGEPITVEVDEVEGEATYWEYERHPWEGFYPKPDECRPALPGIVADASALRALLLQLNLKVSLTWVPSGKRFFKLHRAEITGDAGAANFDTDSIATLNSSGRSTRGRFSPASRWRCRCFWRSSVAC